MIYMYKSSRVLYSAIWLIYDILKLANINTTHLTSWLVRYLN